MLVLTLIICSTIFLVLCQLNVIVTLVNKDFGYSKRGRGAEVDKGIPSSTSAGAKFKNEAPAKRYDYTFQQYGSYQLLDKIC